MNRFWLSLGMAAGLSLGSLAGAFQVQGGEATSTSGRKYDGEFNGPMRATDFASKPEAAFNARAYQAAGQVAKQASGRTAKGQVGARQQRQDIPPNVSPREVAAVTALQKWASRSTSYPVGVELPWTSGKGLWPMRR